MLPGWGQARGSFELPLRGVHPAGGVFSAGPCKFVGQSAGPGMVEGPGCTLNGEKIRARVRPGQAVTDVRGSALQNAGGPGLPLSASETVVPSQVSLSCIFLGASRGKRNNPIKFSGVQGVLSLL